MSETSQGSGWWQASDGKWYPPELHPSAAAVMPPPTAPPQATTNVPVTPTGPLVPSKKPLWRRWWAIALAVVVVLIGLGALVSPGDEEESDAEVQRVADASDAEDAAAPVTEPRADTSEDQATEDDEVEPVAATEPETTVAVATTAPAPETPPAGTREQPYAVGSPAQVTLETFGDADGSVWTITVDGPGSDITQAVLDENMFNEPPAEGRLFYGVPVSLRLDSAGKEPLSPLFNISLEFFGPSTLEIISDGLSEGCGVTPNELDEFKEVFVGGSISGTVCFSVTPDDVAAGILLTLDEVEGDRLFFATVAGQGVTVDAPVSEPVATPAPSPDEEGAVGTRSAPHPVGSPTQVTLETFGDADGSVWTISVDGPGSDITQAVLDENMFNEPPAEGRLFYGVPVTLRLESAGKEPLSPLFNIQLEFFGPSTLEIMSDGMSEGCGVTPNELDPFKEVFVGGAIAGTVCYSVTPADVDAGIMLTLDEVAGGRVFFATR